MANNIKIGIVVNDVAKLDLGLNMVIKSTIEALKRDHKVFLMGIGDLYFDGDEKVYSKAVSVPKKDYKVLDLFIEDILNLEKENSIIPSLVCVIAIGIL